MVEKKKRGRPRLDISDSERIRRNREANARNGKNSLAFRITGEARKRFDLAKEKQEKQLGFTLTVQQFMTILLTRWENDES
tara:strand:- start:1145 stop:1387 length:243 start_codon:yes stop_codon:yes gene_type:complete